MAFAKTPKDWRQSMPTKMRRLANRNALLSKIVDQELKIVDKFDFKAPKTQQFAKVLDALSVNRTCLLALDPDDRNTALSARNLTDVDIIQIEQLNAFDLLNHRFVVVEREAFEQYIAALKPTSAKVASGGSDKEAA